MRADSCVIWVLGLAVWVLILTPPAWCHPQCLDFRPPFKPSPRPFLCRQYSNFSCCDAARDRQIYIQYYWSIIRHPNITQALQCWNLLDKVFCLPCSPYAAHVYDAESDGIPSSFPGLCRNFCLNFLSRCRYFVSAMTTDQRLRIMARDPSRDELFCQVTAIPDSVYCYPNVFNNQTLQTDLVNTSSSSPQDGCICLEEFAANLRNPLIFKHFPDGSGRVLVGEQVGVMYVYSRAGRRERQPFLDLSRVVLVSSSGGDERGLLGFAFHPNYPQNGKFYCYFYLQRDGRSYTQLREFRVSSTNRNRALTSSRLLLEMYQPYGNHNGGETTFGPDGYLYLFTGDGGAGGDPGNRAQNKNSLLGKALRINVNVPTGSSLPYAIPRDNPFVNRQGRDEIFAYGLRNPWRCDVDEGDRTTGRGRGRIFCGDVGQSAFEEIDIVERGKNYGWRVKEGFACYNPRQNCGPVENEGLPIFTYNRTVGRSVIGGHVYRGCLSPALNGAYIFGDYDTGVLFKLEENPSGSWRETKIETCGRCSNGLVNQLERNILSFGEDQNGEVYILTTSSPSSSQARGKIYKIVDPGRRGNPANCRYPTNRG